MRSIILTLSMAGGLLAATADAQTVPTQARPAPSPTPAMPMRGGGMGGGMGGLMRADADGDGTVTREEAVAAADARFAALDTNHDGSVTADEMRGGMRNGGPQGAAAPPPAAAVSPMASMNRQQFHDGALRQFDRVDANHDGKVDQAEIGAYREMMRGRRQERQGGAMPPAAGGQQ